MEFILAGISNLGILQFLVIPFLIWSTAESLWVGFFFPLIETFGNKQDEYERGRRFVWKTGFGRILHYKWGIFFSSLGGILIMDIYWLILKLADELLPSFVYILILSLGSFLLGILLFSKGVGIMSEAYPSSVGSIKYFLGGYRNPFEEAGLSETREVVEKVNQGLRD